MPDPELIQKWERIESDLRAALTTVRLHLSDKDAAQVTEYLDHNELGLALEHLTASLLASEVTELPPATLARLRRANDEMGTPSPGSWRTFTSRFG
jgi:hypothetical protein